MAQKPETIFRRKIVPKLQGLPNTYVLSIQQQSISGHPDLLLCVAGFFVALEIKKSIKDKPRPLQEYVLERIRQARGKALAVCPENFEETFAALKKLANSKPNETE